MSTSDMKKSVSSPLPPPVLPVLPRVSNHYQGKIHCYSINKLVLRHIISTIGWTNDSRPFHHVLFLQIIVDQSLLNGIYECLSKHIALRYTCFKQTNISQTLLSDVLSWILTGFVQITAQDLCFYSSNKCLAFII